MMTLSRLLRKLVASLDNSEAAGAATPTASENDSETYCGTDGARDVRRAVGAAGSRG